MNPAQLFDSLQRRLTRGRHWRAQWIWDDVPGNQKNRFVLFRHSVDGAPSKPLRLHLSADSRYRLWVNGEFAGRGPVQSQPYHQFYDSYPVESGGDGRVDLAVEVYYSGILPHTTGADC